MSVESAKAFLANVQNNEVLQEKLKPVDSEAKFFAVASGAGFDFSSDEWVSILPPRNDGALCAAHWDQCTSWSAVKGECVMLLPLGIFDPAPWGLWRIARGLITLPLLILGVFLYHAILKSFLKGPPQKSNQNETLDQYRDRLLEEYNRQRRARVITCEICN